MARIQMELIPEPKPGTAAVLVLERPHYIMKDPYVIIRSVGDTDYVCGCCRVTIAACVMRGMLVNIVLKCSNCGSYNIVQGT